MNEAFFSDAARSSTASDDWPSRISVSHQLVVTFRLKLAAGKTFRTSEGTSNTEEGTSASLCKEADGRAAVSESGRVEKRKRHAAAINRTVPRMLRPGDIVVVDKRLVPIRYWANLPVLRQAFSGS